MVPTRIYFACGELGVFWQEGEPPGCADAAHEHQRFEVHHHRTPVTLPDGAVITAVSFDAADPYARDREPDFGLYLDRRWQPPWSHAHVDWPDFGVPDDTAVVTAALEDLLGRARAGERVEIGCLGAHGRTGTALAALGVLSGVPADDAVRWVRAAYCDRAIETPEQEAFVAAL